MDRREMIMTSAACLLPAVIGETKRRVMARIILADVPSINDRVYPGHLIVTALPLIKACPVLEYPDGPEIARVEAWEFDGAWLIAIVAGLPREIEADLENGSVCLMPCVHGTVDTDYLGEDSPLYGRGIVSILSGMNFIYVSDAAESSWTAETWMRHVPGA